MDLRTGQRHGWEAVTLEDDDLSVTVLPGKGAEVTSLVHRASGTDVLFAAPWGLQPPGSPPREGSDGAPFLENYAGGWQELFPTAGDPCEHRGRSLPFHGEVATVPWRWRALDDAGLGLSVDCPISPLRLEREMRLGGGALRVDQTAVNLSDEAEEIVWGHLLVLGPPLVAAGARLLTPARTIVTIPELWEQTARLEPGQRSRWPMGRLRDGGEVDLSQIPGEEAGSHDDVYLTDLDGGWAEVVNDALDLRVRLDWDPQVFRWIISWQPYGGARAMPLAGAYALGVEPWVSGGDLAAAAAAGEAHVLEPHGRLSTTVTVTIGPADG
jgi:hypothetical protein